MPKIFAESKFKAYLKLIAEGMGTTNAARNLNASPKTFYDKRQKDKKFAAAYQEAIDLGVEKLEAEAMRRAVLGVEEPVFYQGKPVGFIRKYSDTMLIFLMKAAHPKKYRESYQSVKQPTDSIPVPVLVVKSVTEARDMWTAFVDETMAKTGQPRDVVIAQIVAQRPDSKEWLM